MVSSYTTYETSPFSADISMSKVASSATAFSSPVGSFSTISITALMPTSPSSVLKRLAVTENIDMSVNEYTNVSFGHIIQPPGMSPAMNYSPTEISNLFTNAGLNALSQSTHISKPNFQMMDGMSLELLNLPGFHDISYNEMISEESKQLEDSFDTKFENQVITFQILG